MVKSNYVVIVKTHHFNNPRSLLSNGSCCDVNETRSDGSCAVPGCDVTFAHCLNTGCRESKYLDIHECTISMVGHDEQGLDFSASTLLGTPNPLYMRGLTNEWIPNVSCG